MTILGKAKELAGGVVGKAKELAGGVVGKAKGLAGGVVGKVQQRRGGGNDDRDSVAGPASTEVSATEKPKTIPAQATALVGVEMAPYSRQLRSTGPMRG